MVPSIEILSREIIKPSSPTPHHLRNHNLSPQDQLQPPVYTPLIFFYQPEIKYQIISQLLKQSLSNTLTKFYPLAGRWINGTSSIDCNDYGVEYVETRVHAQLAQIIKESSMEEFSIYLPKDPLCLENFIEGVSNILLAIQVNFFSCGGIAVGVSISHKIADGSSLATFMKSWADTCRTRDAADHHVTQPVLDFTTHFSPKDLSSIDSNNDRYKLVPEEKIVTKRFVFNKEKLATLKKLVASDYLKNPSRVEAVTSFLWNHFIKLASTTEDDNKKLFALLHAVNLRPRMNPPLSGNSIGNICWHALALSTPEENKDYRNLGSKLRDSFRNINGEYIKKIQQGDDFLTSLKNLNELLCNKDVEICAFTSWCKFPIYEVDYGWGKPIWVCTATLAVKNLVLLMSTSCGEGIEACVSNIERNFSALENDFKFL